jgi:D-alanine-D-alanine ligase
MWYAARNALSCGGSMQNPRLRIALIYGGQSAEHEVSLRSARSIFDAMDRSKYDPVPILITQQGSWYCMPAEAASFAPSTNPAQSNRLIFSPDPQHKGFLKLEGESGIQPMHVDLVFPVLHGTYGEDGTIQGLLEMAHMPYVGCGVLASAVGMDKILMKKAFRENGLNVGPYFWFFRSEWESDPDKITAKLKSAHFPLFVKPANLGSSVGISKVSEPSGFASAVNLAASYDRKILVEDGIEGRELEVSVLGNEHPEASLPGEVISHSSFYDYEEKYLKDTAELVIPAELPADMRQKAQEAAIIAFRAVDGSGLGRVDMFLTPDNRVVVNEINTLPGFTSISMYPKLWEATGLPYAQLVDKLVELAQERHREKLTIRTDRKPV